MVSNWKTVICALLTIATGGWNYAHGQAASEAPRTPSRVTGPISDAKLVQLRGNIPPAARPEFDRGQVDLQLPMERMLLILRRSPEQEASLEAFMARQLDPKSPDFHHWLEPSEFGALYGPSDYDIQSVTTWLQNRGFTINSVSKGRVFIEFSGTAGLVQQAFHTQIHHYMVRGAEHIANSSDPNIPEALSPVVTGIFSLHNFFTKPLHRDMGSFRRDAKNGKWTPVDDTTLTKPLFGVPTYGAELVSPFDFATIYNVLPLWNASIDGTGQTIAIAGRSDISLTDVATFRSSFGLPANAPTIIVNGTDPGIPSADDKVENTLDVEWSGAVAKGATIKFVTTASTSTTDGAASSAAYIIDNKTAPIMSFSYGACELAFGTAGNAFYNALWQQGAAEGITEFVASGDQGSAACDGGGTPPYGAIDGFAVSGTSSTPYNVAVGGTDLNWANSSTTYWNATNAANGSSAIGYIPEVPWNSTCTSDAVDEFYGFTGAGFDEEQSCQYMVANDFDVGLVQVVGGTGGVSACTTPSGTTPATCSGGYAKPSWQTGTGVPADGKRDVPDVSLFASSGVLNSAYVICDSDISPCTYSNDTDAVDQGVGGTSVSSPAMAGIMALVNQKMGSAQGNANAGFYGLAALDNRSSCNSTTVGSGNACNFYDITTDNNAVPCIPNSPNCTVHHSGDVVGVLNGYTSTPGYDLSTGLGSVNANNLVNNWHLVAAATAIPAVSTGAASSVTTTAATVAGTANPEGSSTQAYFRYGTSSTLSSSTSTTMQSIGAGSSNVNVTASLSGLTVNTTYYYQIWATNSAGTVAGPINSFTTLATVPLPTVTTGAATSVTSSSATLSGTANPNGASTNAIFRYGTSSTLSGATSTASQNIGAGGTAVNVSAGISGLTANTKYYYQIQATNSAGTASGAINSFTTSPVTTTTGLQFIPVTPCRIADTRNATGPFGGPELAANTSRAFNIPQSACSIPTTAVAYSLNVTVVPGGSLGYLTLWPTGQTQPVVSLLNSD
ncbi:MAG TPA: protease pro-enzyme activation domain-containing protein, partial [Alloacidobacterium sp.]|nr:protease pro-enzyme activation domain-containing protein [Alloacidobacterium sp.]